MAILGSGDFKYEKVPEWPKMPKYWEFGAASDAAINSKGEIYVFSRGFPFIYNEICMHLGNFCATD